MLIVVSFISPRSFWLTVQHTFYGGFALVGGVVEVLGLISTGMLLFLLRERRGAFALTLVAALSFAAMLALFALGNTPLNQQIMIWTPRSCLLIGARTTISGIDSMQPAPL